MAGYPTTDSERVVSSAVLRRLSTEIFAACGMSPDDAALLSETLVSADLRGIHSHGMVRVPEYVRKLQPGGVDPRGTPRVVSDNAAALVIDGGNSMGQIAAAFAMQRAIERARQTQVAVAVVRGSNHCGAMEHFARLALAHDMIGLVTTNALPTMAPWGGCDKIVGINPLGIAVPAGAEHPLVFDGAFSASSHGKLRIYQQKGLPIPEGWAFDRNGVPTTDTAAAIDGLLRPIGDYKGVALAIMMGVFSSLLSGAAYGTELGNMVDGPRAGHDGHFLMAINVAAFEDVARFKSRVDDIVRQIESSRRTAGVPRFYAPGGLEAETEVRYQREGIQLTRAILHDFAECAKQFHIDCSEIFPN